MYNQKMPEDSEKMLLGRDYTVDSNGVIIIRSLTRIIISKIIMGIAVVSLILALGWLVILPIL